VSHLAFIVKARFSRCCGRLCELQGDGAAFRRASSTWVWCRRSSGRVRTVIRPRPASMPRFGASTRPADCNSPAGVRRRPPAVAAEGRSRSWRAFS